MRPLSIAHIALATGPPIPSRVGGAKQRIALELARAQARRGHRVQLFSVGDEHASREIDGVGFRYLPVRANPPLRNLEFQWRAVTRIRREHPTTDVLHFHSQPEGGLFASSLKASTVLSYDYSEFRKMGRWRPLVRAYRPILRRFGLLLPVSMYSLETSAALWGLPTNRMKVCYNGVNLEQFHPDQRAGDRMRESLALEGDVVLYVGRICRQKGVDLLLEAWRSLGIESGRHLVLAGPIGSFGTGPQVDRAGWKERLAAAGAIYLGVVSEERLADVYNMASVFVMPTRELEMFGMAAVEAQACGKPVVASDHGGLRETVPVDCGARFPVGDTDSLAARICELLEDADLYERRSAAARANAGRFSWETIAEDLDGFYETLLSRNSGKE